MKELLHFSHGNGFPSGCYRQLLTPFSDSYEVLFIDRIGHSPDYPVTDNWVYLVDEVIDSISSQANQKVIAMGHSLGGVLTLLAAIKRPDLIKAVVVIESPLIGTFESIALRLAKKLNIIDHLSPSKRTRGRRHFWPTRENVMTYLLQKKLFEQFTPKALEDYIDYGLHASKDGYSLRFDRGIESLIYRTIPHTLANYGRNLEVPALLIYGDNSNVMNNRHARYMERKYNITTKKMPGTHMIPMEHPIELALSIQAWLNELQLYTAP